MSIIWISMCMIWNFCHMKIIWRKQYENHMEIILCENHMWRFSLCKIWPMVILQTGASLIQTPFDPEYSLIHTPVWEPINIYIGIGNIHLSGIIQSYKRSATICTGNIYRCPDKWDYICTGNRGVQISETTYVQGTEVSR